MSSTFQTGEASPSGNCPIKKHLQPLLLDLHTLSQPQNAFVRATAREQLNRIDYHEQQFVTRQALARQDIYSSKDENAQASELQSVLQAKIREIVELKESLKKMQEGGKEGNR